jgi:cytochrome c biogenesis protein CcdA
MIDAPLAAAFTAGMVATVNPCGFAMLPAYLGYFLGIDQGDDAKSGASVGRALLVGTVVSAGFLLLFAIAGALVQWTSIAVGQFSPWLTIIIGVLLFGMGVAFLAGWEPALALPRLDKGGRTRGLWSMFVFGISYAVASLSCTIGPFTAVVATTFARESFASGVATFVAYGLGMALLLMVLTVSLALARQGVLTKLRSALPYFTRVAGGIMVIAGAYLAWYGVYEIRLIQQGRQDATRGPVGLVTTWSSDISNWLGDLDPLQVALFLALVVCGGVLVALLRSRPRTPDEPTTHEPTTHVDDASHST